MFDNAACISMSIDYTQKGEAYIITSIVIQAENLILGNGIEFTNHWIK